LINSNQTIHLPFPQPFCRCLWFNKLHFTFGSKSDN